MPSFSIKQASAADIPAIISIQEKTWQPTYKDILTQEQIDYMFEKIYSHEALENQITIQHHHFLLLMDGYEAIGFSSVSEDEPELFKLHKIYVLPSTQGTGAGKFLLAATEEYVRKTGGKTLVLNVNRHNKARGFYEKMGFVTIGEKDIPIGPYWMNDYILKKEIR